MRLAMVLVGSLVVAGCTSPETGPLHVDPPLGEVAVLRHVACSNGWRNLTAPEGHLLRTEDDLLAVWPRLCGERLPAVDFSTESLLLRVHGWLPYGPADLEVVSVHGNETGLTVHVRRTSNGEGCPSTMAFIYLADAVVVQALPDVDVQWNVEAVRRPPCG